MTAASRAVCLDIGRTSCRVQQYDVRDPAAPRATSAPTAFESGTTLADVDGPAQVAWLVANSLDAIDPAATRTALVVGVAGGLEYPAAVTELAELLASAPWLQTTVTGDIVTAHAGALRGGRGVVLVAGTGAVALAVDATGQITKVDGNGYLLGDAGSGFSVGRAGLEAALRHRDGRPDGSEELAEAAEARFGGLATFPARLQAGADAARRVASFAVDVAEQARGGDQRSIEIWQHAVDDLTESVVAAGAAVAADGRVEDVAVALAGGLFDTTDLLTDPLCARLREQFPGIGPAEGDALLGAARLASGPAGVYEPLLVRRSTAPDAPEPATPQRKTEEARR